MNNTTEHKDFHLLPIEEKVLNKGFLLIEQWALTPQERPIAFAKTIESYRGIELFKHYMLNTEEISILIDNVNKNNQKENNMFLYLTTLALFINYNNIISIQDLDTENQPVCAISYARNTQELPKMAIEQGTCKDYFNKYGVLFLDIGQYNSDR